MGDLCTNPCEIHKLTKDLHLHPQIEQGQYLIPVGEPVGSWKRSSIQAGRWALNLKRQFTAVSHGGRKAE
jgi:hypothetical protein